MLHPFQIREASELRGSWPLTVGGGFEDSNNGEAREFPFGAYPPLVALLERQLARNLERAGGSRSVAMSLTGHKTEAVYRRYAIVDSSAQREGVAKLAAAANGHKMGTIGA